MNDAELDRKLKTASGQARRFFDGWLNAPERAPAVISRQRRQYFRPHARMRACAAGLCIVAAAAVCAVLILSPGTHGTTVTDRPADAATTAQTVYLSEEKAYRVNTVPVDMPDDGAGLITVLWEMRSGGKGDMAYYSLFEACDTAYPAMTIPFSGTDYDMLLIASGDSQHDSLGYRLIGCSGDALSTWWSQDGVPGGLVTISDGVAVERRGTGDETAVTYIVPIQMLSPGYIVLPVESLRMSVGERILLVGAGGDGISATTQSGLLAAEEQPQESGVPAVLMRALSAGKAVVSVGPKEEARTLTVEIGE